MFLTLSVPVALLSAACLDLRLDTKHSLVCCRLLQLQQLLSCLLLSYFFAYLSHLLSTIWYCCLHKSSCSCYPLVRCSRGPRPCIRLQQSSPGANRVTSPSLLVGCSGEDQAVTWTLFLGGSRLPGLSTLTHRNHKWTHFRCYLLCTIKKYGSKITLCEQKCMNTFK